MQDLVNEMVDGSTEATIKRIEARIAIQGEPKNEAEEEYVAGLRDSIKLIRGELI